MLSKVRRIVRADRARGTSSVALAIVAAALCASCAGRAETTATPPAEEPVLAQRAEPTAAIRLTGEPTPSGVRLEAIVTVTGRLPEAATLQIVVPDGVRVVEGVTVEQLREPKPGTTLTRTWTLEGTTGPVTVSLRAVSDAAGLSVDAVWPPQEPTRPAAAAPATERIPPVKVHGVTIESSIPIAPTKREH